MNFYGYGYRKNCFGNRVFYEDETTVYSKEEMKKTLAKCLDMTKKDMFFSFKFCANTDGCWSVERTCEDAQNDVFTVTYSPRWNSTNVPQKMSKQAIIKTIVSTVYSA